MLQSCLDAVPISIDKTKVKEPEQQPEEPPANVVRKCHGQQPEISPDIREKLSVFYKCFLFSFDNQYENVKNSPTNTMSF